MHFLGEIEAAVEAITESGNDKIVLLHCVSNYPPAPETLNLRNIPMLQDLFGLPVGLSDHSTNNYAAIASVALGTCVIEKHVTLDRRLEGPDHFFCSRPCGMKDLVEGIRTAERALGTAKRVLSEAERATRKVARRSIVAKTSIAKGVLFTKDNLKLSRPGNGLHPKYLKCCWAEKRE